jgi:hypothetical protein
LSPNIPVDEWDALLKDTGFTGVDEVLRDFDGDGSYDQAYLVATACETEPAVREPRATVTLVAGPSEPQQKLVENLTGPLTDQLGAPP